MAYKVYTKKLSAYETRLKQARHERRQAKRLRTLSLQELRSPEQLEERFNAALASMNAHVRSIVETDHPEALPLMRADMVQTVRSFSEADMVDTLKVAMRQCDEELTELFWVFVLGCRTTPASTDAAGSVAP